MPLRDLAGHGRAGARLERDGPGARDDRPAPLRDRRSGRA